MPELVLPVTAARTRRRAIGAYYTPPHIATRLAIAAVGPLAGSAPRVIDPACGDGAFLAAAREAAPDAQLLGVDRDPEAATAARARGFEVWQADALLSQLPEGFDALVGNPPFLSVKRAPFPPAERASLAARYVTARGQFDACALFVERAIDLLRPGGRYALVLPRQILGNGEHAAARALLFTRAPPEEVVDLGTPFPGAAVEVVGLVGRRLAGGEPAGPVRLTDAAGGDHGRVERAEWSALPALRLPLRAEPGVLALRAKIALDAPPLSAWLTRLTRGIEAGRRDPALSNSPQGRLPVLSGRDVKPGTVAPPSLFLDPGALPAHRLKDRALYETPAKILVRRVADRIVAAVDRSGAFALNTLYCLHPAEGVNPDALAAMLNSRLVTFWWRASFGADDRIFPYVRTGQLASLPMRLPPGGAVPASDDAACALYDLTPKDRALLYTIG